MTEAVLVAQSGDGGSSFSGALLVYLVIMFVAGVVMFFVLHRETRARRKARNTPDTGPAGEDRQT